MSCLTKYFITILLLLSLSGCTSTTPKDVRESELGLKAGSKQQFTFIATENYQTVYRKILIQTRDCYQIEGHALVQGNHFHDTNSATITVLQGGLYAATTEQVIDILAIGEQQTKVDVYYPVYPVKFRAVDYGQRIKEWVLDNSKECD